MVFRSVMCRNLFLNGPLAVSLDISSLKYKKVFHVVLFFMSSIIFTVALKVIKVCLVQFYYKHWGGGGGGGRVEGHVFLFTFKFCRFFCLKITGKNLMGKKIERIGSCDFFFLLVCTSVLKQVFLDGLYPWVSGNDCSTSFLCTRMMSHG